MAPLDVQDHVVAIGLMKPDVRSVAARHDRELHLVPVPVRVRRGQDGAQLELAEPADALEANAHLLFLEAELCGVGEVLQATAAAAAEICAGGLHSILPRGVAA